MNIRSYVVAIASVAALAGCVDTSPMKTAFNPSEFSSATERARGEVTGQAFMRRNDGIVVYGAGSPVRLLPVTNYTRELVASSLAGKLMVNMARADSRLSSFTLTTTADGEGKFRFDNVPAGPYYVYTTVQWMAGDAAQGGDIIVTQNISAGQTTNVILTR